MSWGLQGEYSLMKKHSYDTKVVEKSKDVILMCLR
jgi:hypothetical protein